MKRKLLLLIALPVIILLVVMAYYFTMATSTCTSDCWPLFNWEKKCVYEGCVPSSCSGLGGTDMEDYIKIGYPYSPPQEMTQEEIQATGNWTSCNEPNPLIN